MNKSTFCEEGNNVDLLLLSKVSKIKANGFQNDDGPWLSSLAWSAPYSPQHTQLFSYLMAGWMDGKRITTENGE